MDHGKDFHSVIGSVLIVTADFFFVAVIYEQGSPSSYSRVTGAGSVGIDVDSFHFTPKRNGVYNKIYFRYFPKGGKAEHCAEAAMVQGFTGKISRLQSDGIKGASVKADQKRG